MKINKNIIELADKHNSSPSVLGVDAETLQYIWNNRNKPWLFVVNNYQQTASFSLFKVAIIKGSQFIDITATIAEVTNNKYDRNTGNVKINGGNMDMRFNMLNNFLGYLIPKNSKLKSYHFKSVNSYNQF